MAELRRLHAPCAFSQIQMYEDGRADMFALPIAQCKVLKTRDQHFLPNCSPLTHAVVEMLTWPPDRVRVDAAQRALRTVRERLQYGNDFMQEDFIHDDFDEEEEEEMVVAAAAAAVSNGDGGGGSDEMEEEGDEDGTNAEDALADAVNASVADGDNESCSAAPCTSLYSDSSADHGSDSSSDDSGLSADS